MADLLIVFLAILGSLIVAGMIGWLPQIGSGRKMFEGEKRIPLGHRYFLQTATDLVRIIRLGSDWIIPEGEAIPHYGFVFSGPMQNVFINDALSKVGREVIFYSAMCLDQKLRYDFPNPMVSIALKRNEEQIKEYVMQQNKLNHMDNLRSRELDAQKSLNELVETHHAMHRAFGVRGMDKLRGGVGEQRVE